MLKQEDKDKLKALGFDVSALENAVKSETETAITLPTGQFISDDLLSTRDNNNIETGKRTGKEEGKRIGFEIAHKTLIDKFGLKDVAKTDETNKIIDVLQTVVSSGDSGLKKQVDDLLKDKTDLSTEIDTLKKNHESTIFEFDLLSKLPKERETILSDKEYLALIKPNIEEVDGIKGLKINGEVLRDTKTRSVVPIDKAVNQLFDSRGWIKKDAGNAGRGAGDDNKGGGGYRTYSDAEKAYIAKNGEDSNLGVKYQAYIAELAKSPDFDMTK